MRFRFVGTLSEVGTQRLTRLGEQIEIPVDLVDVMVYARGGAKVVTEEQFASAGFTDEELTKHATTGAQFGASPEVQAKLAKVRALVGINKPAAPAREGK